MCDKVSTRYSTFCSFQVLEAKELNVRQLNKNNGKEYVGSACGGCGIWNRWKDYVADGHGGNKELKKIVKDKGFEYIQNTFITLC